MKVYYIIMAAMSAIVFAFACAGTADYWYRQTVPSTWGSGASTVPADRVTQIGLWRMKTQTKVDGKEVAKTVVKIQGAKADKAIDASGKEVLAWDTTTCKKYREHFQAVAAFAILTCIFSFVALLGFVLNIIGQEVPLGFGAAAATIVFDLIAWAIGTAMRNRPFCDGRIHLDDKANPIVFKFHHGWYFFLIPWILYVLAFLVAIALKSMDKGEETTTTTVTTTKEVKVENNEKTETTTTTTTTETAKTEEKTETREANPLAAGEKKDDSEDKKKAEEQAAADKKKADDEEAARKQKEADDEKKADEEAEKKRVAEEKARAEEEERQAKEEEAEMARELNAADVERRKKIWSELKENLPTDKADKEQRRRRFDLFEKFDRGQKKYLTPADLDVGCKTELGLGQLKKGLAHILPKAHANARAVHQAKGVNKKQSEENVERSEFRLVLVNIKELFDLWFMFDTLDVADSGKISQEEFERGIPDIKSWGKDVEDSKAEFEKADTGKTGKINFNEFCDWARTNKLEDGDDTDDDEKLEEENEDDARARNAADVARRRAIWKDLAHRLPTNKKSKEERARRFQYFREFDTNNNGFLTLADVEEGCSTVLGLGQLGKGLKHLLPLAHNSARGVANVKGQKESADEHVEKSEMRLLFVYIHQYFDLWFLFDTLDVANTGHISYDEFVTGIHEVEEWAGIKIEDPKAEFEAADTGKTGSIIFLEFCEWAHHKNTKDE